MKHILLGFGDKLDRKFYLLEIGQLLGSFKQKYLSLPPSSPHYVLALSETQEKRARSPEGLVWYRGIAGLFGKASSSVRPVNLLGRGDHIWNSGLWGATGCYRENFWVYFELLFLCTLSQSAVLLFHGVMGSDSKLPLEATIYQSIFTTTDSKNMNSNASRLLCTLSLWHYSLNTAYFLTIGQLLLLTNGLSPH